MTDYPPLFSVIIPVFNGADRIEQAIQSVRAQSLSSWELIIIDDGSTDHTLALVEQAAARDPRIRPLRQANQGPSAARNFGILAARGRYLAFLDADDAWHPERLRAGAGHFAAHPEAGIVFSRVILDVEGADGKSRVTAHHACLDVADLLAENPVCTTSNMMVRAALVDRIGGFDPLMSHIEDQELLLRAAATSPWRVEGIDRPLIRYTIAAGTRSSDFSKTEESWHHLMRQARRWCPERSIGSWRLAEAAFYLNQARRAVRQSGLWATTCGYLARAFRADPLLVLRTPRRCLFTLGRLSLNALTQALSRPQPQLKETM